MQTKKVQGRSTRIVKGDPWTLVVYHTTAVVTFSTDAIELNTGGYRSFTTRLRMNQASNQFNLGYFVWQHEHEWYLRYQDHVYLFAGNRLMLDRNTGLVVNTDTNAMLTCVE